MQSFMSPCLQYNMLSDLFIRTFNFYLIFRTKFRTKCLTFWSHFCQLLHLRNNYSFCENFSECKLQVSFVARLDEMAAPKSPECLAIPGKRHQDVCYYQGKLLQNIWQYQYQGNVSKMSANTKMSRNTKKSGSSKMSGITTMSGSTMKTIPRCLAVTRKIDVWQTQESTKRSGSIKANITKMSCRKTLQRFLAVSTKMLQCCL